MARWIMLGLTIIGVVVVFTTKSAGLLALGLLFGIVGFFGFIMTLAADRISATARPETAMAAVDDLAALRRKRPIPPSTRPAAAAAVPPIDSVISGHGSPAVVRDPQEMDPSNRTMQRSTP